MSCCKRCVPTPQSILDDTTTRDVFAEIFGNDDSDEFAVWAQSMMWARYRYTGIGNCDVNYWVRCMLDRYHIIEKKWRLRFETLETFEPTNIELDDYSIKSETESTFEDFPNTVVDPNNQYLSNRSRGKSSVSQDTGMLFERINKYNDAIRDYSFDFCQEFEDLFYRGL